MEIRISGRTMHVPSARIGDRTVIVMGKWVRIASIRDEDLVEGAIFEDPESFVCQLRQSGLKADVLTFAQKAPGAAPKYHYYMEWDNWAAVQVKSFDDWWKKLPQETRKNVRRAERRGVVVRVVPFTDELVKGIQEIYNESPIRQGRPFWHHQIDFEDVKRRNATYPDRSEFIAAYFHDELIGFVKIIYADRTAQFIQILGKSAHVDKRPMNALIAKSVEVCLARGIDYLIYSKIAFGNKTDSSLAEFKRRNGFEQILLPRYYVPVTFKGRLAIKMRLHRDLLGLLPPRCIKILLKVRAWYFQRKFSSGPRTVPV